MSAQHQILVLAALVAVSALLIFIVLVIGGSALMRRLRADFERRVERQLREQFIAIDSSRLWVLQCMASLGVATLVAGLSQSAIAVVLAAVCAAAIPRILIRHLQALRRERLRRQIPDALMLMAGAMRAGSGVSVAMARAASASPSPARPHLERVLGDLRLGTSMAEALHSFERRAGVEEVTLIATAIRVGSETGGPLAATLESLADAIRRRLAIESRIRALTAQGRLQAWVMALLPAVVLALLAVVDPPSFNEIIFTQGGRIVLAAVVIAQVLGFRMVRRIVRIEV
jgi:tight adherence protein B